MYAKKKLLNGYLTSFRADCGPFSDVGTLLELQIRCTNSDAYAVRDFMLAQKDVRSMCFPIQIDGAVACDESKLNFNLVTNQALSVRAVDVIFNDPATIVFWSDNTKTVVKRQPGDTYSPEAGLAMCYMKKALGNSSRAFNDALKPAKDKEDEDTDVPNGLDFLKQMAKMMQQPEREEK